jgi:hypothetical protein
MMGRSAGVRPLSFPFASARFPPSTVPALLHRRYEDVRWRAQRARVDRFSLPYFAGGSQPRRALFITHAHPIASSQIFPHFYFRHAIARRYGVQVGEISLEAFEALPASEVPQVDIVCLQTWFDVDRTRLQKVFDRARELCRPAKVVYFDCFAPTDLRLAEAIGDRADLYVKKHVLRDRSAYGERIQGDTNLMEYYCRRYNIDCEETAFPIPEGFLARLHVGPSFATADYLMPYFRSGHMQSTRKTIDVHARLGRQGTEWYEAMRNESLQALDGLRGFNVAKEFGVGRRQYLRELGASKICYSPFGYGEVAWRDYEAIAYGSLLLKPDMSHLETDPDVFIAGETYVPVKWDFSDVEEKSRYYLENRAEREAIAERAFAKLHEYFRSDGFVAQHEPVYEPVSTRGTSVSN